MALGYLKCHAEEMIVLKEQKVKVQYKNSITSMIEQAKRAHSLVMTFEIFRILHTLRISLKFDESKAPIEKLDHIKFWHHSSIIIILGFVVT